jgi:two-component system, cell cycle sensor histidine kinase and response regulator CckA
MPQPSKKENQPDQTAFSDPHDILMNAPIGVYTSTPEGRYMSANPALAEMYGYDSPEELIESVTDIAEQLYVDAADREEVSRLLEVEGRVYNYECRLRRKDGSIIWTSRNVREVRDSSGKNIHYQGFVTDITRSKQTRQELDETRWELSTILDSVPVMIWRKDQDSKYIHANKMFCDIVGRELEDIKGKSDYDVHPEEIATKYVSDDKLVLSSGRPVRNISERHKKSTGQTGWSLTEKLPCYDKDGNIAGTIGFALDITEIKRADDALRGSEERFQKMLGVVPDMISIHSPEMDILYSNWQGFGAVPETMRKINTKCYNTYRGRTDVCSDCRAISVLDTKKPIREETRLSDGTWLDLRVIPLLDKNNQVEMFMEWVRDITERKQAEEALQKSEEKLSGILNNMTDVVWSVSWPDLTHNYLSPSLERLYGRSKQEFFDNPTLFKDVTHPDDQHLTEKAMKQLVEEGESERECRIIKPDGSMIWVNDRSKLIYDENHQPIRVEGVTRDITERKQAEEEREKLQSQLFQAQKMESIGILAGGIAHDFNNLLHVMGGNLELLDRKIHENHPGKKRIPTIRKSMDRAAQLVRQMLMFSRKADVRTQVLDLNQEIHDAVKLLERSIPRMISIELILDENAWSINADPIQVEQVLLNLGTNAAHAMPDGGILLIETANAELDHDFIRTHPEAKPGKYVLMTVTDTGTGMDQDTLEKIFDPFFTTKEVDKGTGLGLASTYGIVKAHEGYITCRSQPGRGTSFKIYWPAVNTELDK